MTFFLRGHSIVRTESNNGVEALMEPGGGALYLKTRDVTIKVSTHDMVEALFGVAHPEVDDVSRLILCAEDDQEMVDMLNVFRANLAACLKEFEER